MRAYRFVRATADGTVLDEQVRDLPDNECAAEWMLAEFLNPGERLEAFRVGQLGTYPLARRSFGEAVEVPE